MGILKAAPPRCVDLNISSCVVDPWHKIVTLRLKSAVNIVAIVFYSLSTSLSLSLYVSEFDFLMIFDSCSESAKAKLLRDVGSDISN